MRRRRRADEENKPQGRRRDTDPDENLSALAPHQKQLADDKRPSNMSDTLKEAVCGGHRRGADLACELRVGDVRHHRCPRLRQLAPHTVQQLVARVVPADLDVRLEAAPAKHAEAILAAYEVLQLMHDKGVLELMRGTLGGGDAVIQQAVAVATEAGSIRAARNTLLLLKTLGELDPELLSDFTRAVAPAFSQACRQQATPPGLFKLLSTFWNPTFDVGLQHSMICWRYLGKI